MTFDEMLDASDNDLRNRLMALQVQGDEDSEEARMIEDELTDRALDEADDFREDQFMSDAEADADVLRSAGMGTDEDYGGDCEHL